MHTHCQADHVLTMVLANRWNAEILARGHVLGVADWWLTAGCIVQSVWNGRYGHPPEHGISDYDFFYFDPDTSWDAENAVIARAAEFFADLPVDIQVRNQARVPLWYEAKFGLPYPPVVRATDGIDRFPCATTAIGIRLDEGNPRIHAPFGLAWLLRGELHPNPVLDIPEIYAQKTRRWRAIWPELVVIPWRQEAKIDDPDVKIS